MSAQQLITEHIDLWTSVIKAKNTQGRGSSKKRELYGVKKLRELILELAVCGKLVEQDPDDEPASVLLERIAAEKERLIRDKKIKNQNPFPKITNEEKPFDLPTGWEWCKLGDLVEMYNGRAFKSSEWSESGIPIVRIQNLNNENADFNYFNGELSEINQIDDGSFLISWSGTPGTSFGAFIWSRGKAALNQHINNCIFNYSSINLEFMRLAVNGCMNHFISMAQGAVGLKHVTKGTLNNAIIGFPAENEQHRIVDKVDELMALCDQLEQQTESSLDAHNLLVDTLLSTLTDARDANELSDNWVRLADHFDTLITTDYAVEQLKQTILQLAVQGKLVPQDPNDESASELLKRIAAEKAQLIKDKKIKKQKLLPEISDEEKPFELPEGWEWSKVGDVALLKGGFAYKSKEFITESDFQVIRMGNIRPDFFRLNENPVFITSASAETTNEYQIAERDILLTMTGTKGKRDYLYSLVVKKPDIDTRNLFLNQRLCIVRPIEVNEMFLNLVMKSDLLLDFVYSKSTGTANQANIGMEAIMNWVIPMASLSEQHRIVAKVDELMTLCDQLKSHLNDAQSTQLHLSDAVVENALTV